MRGIIRAGCVAALLAGGLCGCQCCLLTDPYADAVDWIATHEHHLDPLYHPGLDLTRIGRSDWCQCPVNRLLCPCACVRRKPLPHICEPRVPLAVAIPAAEELEAPVSPPAKGQPPMIDGQPSERGIERSLEGV